MLHFQERSGQVFLLHLLIQLTAAVGQFGNFTDPHEDGQAQTYTLGSRAQVAWETGLERITLTLCRYDGFKRDNWGYDGFSRDYLLNSRNVTNTGSYDWVVGDVVNENNYPTAITNETDILKKYFFYFAIFKPENTTIAFRSKSFTIMPGVSSSASTSSFITSTSPASLATTSVIPSPTATVTSHALSQRAKTGIGVGIGLGTPLLFALGIYLGWRFRGGRNTPGSSRAPTVDTPFISPPSIVEAPNFSRTLELPDSHHQMAHEMSDQASR